MEFINPFQVRIAPTLSGHWYKVTEDGKELGTFPSATTVLNAYPQSVHLMRWIADNGMSEANKLKKDAGIRGTNVHAAVERLLQGDIVEVRNYSLEEWYKIYTFTLWHAEFQPEVLALEMPLFSKKYGYAGRTDLICMIDNKLYIIDFKTSSTLYPHYFLQFAAYAQAFNEMFGETVDETAGLLLGAKNKKGYRMALSPNGWENDFKVFKAVKKVWEFDHGVDENYEAPVLELPEELHL
jgi:hypothetical protein